MIRVLSWVVIPFLVVFLAIRGLLRLLFVPLHRGLLQLGRRLGAFRLVLHLLTLPIHLIAILVESREGTGQVLDGEVIRPTFTIPIAFARGPWTVAAEQTFRCARLEHDGATLEVAAGQPLDVERQDPMARKAIDTALAEPALPNGMRWAGVRISTFSNELSCMYWVWNEAKPDDACVVVTFRGAAALEESADAFVRSALPSLPEVAEPGHSADDALPTGG
jgi:hypothetical protein